jgi:hypothetical protein
MLLAQPQSLTGLTTVPAAATQSPIVDSDTGFIAVATLPFPETMFGDATDLTALQCRLQRFAAAGALSVTVCRVRASSKFFAT